MGIQKGICKVGFFFFFFSIVKKQERIYFSIQFLMQAHASYVIQVHLGSV